MKVLDRVWWGPTNCYLVQILDKIRWYDDTVYYKIKFSDEYITWAKKSQLREVKSDNKN